MKKFYLHGCLLLLSLLGIAQEAVTQRQYSQIPNEFLSHPELGKVSQSANQPDVAYELIQNRTEYSKTFLNTNTTKTTIQSSVPLHYKAGDGKWYSIDYKLSKSQGKIAYPAQQPFFELDGQHAALTVGNERIKFKNQGSFIFMDGNSVVKKIPSAHREAAVENGNEIVFKDIAPNVDKNMALYHQAFKYSYSIKIQMRFRNILIKWLLRTL